MSRVKRYGIGTLVLAWCLSVSIAKADIQARGKVSQASGQVDIYMAAFNKWRPGVRPGQQLFLGDRLRTQSGASAKVALFNPSGEDSIDISQDTLFEIPDVVENEASTSWIGMFSDAVGKISCLVTRKPPGKGEKNPFNVRTPTVVAGVRGTQFNVEYDRRKNTSFVKLNKGVLNGLTYAGAALGLFATSEEVAITGLKVLRYASHLRNAQEFLGGNLEAVNKKYNRLFHVAEYSGAVTVGGNPVRTDDWKRDLPWDATGVDWNNPLVIRVPTGSHVILHMRHTGWIQLDADSELSIYRLGNAVLARLRRGKLHYHRMDPNYKPLKYGPALDVEFFMKMPDGRDLKVIDYTPKGGVTRATLQMGGSAGTLPSAQATQGSLKIMEITYQ